MSGETGVGFAEGLNYTVNSKNSKREMGKKSGRGRERGTAVINKELRGFEGLSFIPECFFSFLLQSK